MAMVTALLTVMVKVMVIRACFCISQATVTVMVITKASDKIMTTPFKVNRTGLLVGPVDINQLGDGYGCGYMLKCLYGKPNGSGWGDGDGDGRGGSWHTNYLQLSKLDEGTEHESL